MFPKKKKKLSLHWMHQNLLIVNKLKKVKKNYGFVFKINL